MINNQKLKYNMPRANHKYHYIYKTTCFVTGRYYIGMHSTSNLDDEYIGSGQRLSKSIKKYGRTNHSKEILEWLNDRESLKNREKEIVNTSLLTDPNCMNLAIGGEGGPNFKGKKHTDEMKRKLSDKTKGKKVSIETRRKISESNRNRKLSNETKKKLSDLAKLRSQSDDNKSKISQATKAAMTAEVKAKISKAAKERELKKKLNRGVEKGTISLGS